MKWKFLWVEDRDKIIDDFCKTDPLIVEIAEKFLEYDSRSEAIRQLPEKHDVGAIRIIMGKDKWWSQFKARKLYLINKLKASKSTFDQ